MNRRRAIASSLPALLLPGLTIAASAPQELPLYAGEIPNSIFAPDAEALRDPAERHAFLMNVSRPTLTIFLPEKPDAMHAGVIVLPGGSYRGVSIQKEGHEVARQLNEFGVTAFVLKYRTPDDRHMIDRTTGALQDVQRAMRVVRTHAADWGVDPARIGLMGFSAGGHLAATAGTHFERPVDGAAGDRDVRPDFLVLVYPVISMTDELTHKVSREVLLGSALSPAVIAAHSPDLAVTSNTPPTLLIHAADDSSVPVGNSLRFFAALRARNVPAQLVIYPAGGHGFGLHNASTPDRWIERTRDWMMSQGWMRRSEVKATHP